MKKYVSGHKTFFCVFFQCHVWLPGVTITVTVQDVLWTCDVYITHNWSKWWNCCSEFSTDICCWKHLNCGICKLPVCERSHLWRPLQRKKGKGWLGRVFTALTFHLRFYTYGNFPLEAHLQFINENVLKNFDRSSVDTAVPLEPRWMHR